MQSKFMKRRPMKTKYLLQPRRPPLKEKHKSLLVSDANSDRDGVQEQLSAVLEYLEKLRPQCTTEPESYEERKARREHEIEGLKTALDILENETAFIQEPKRSLRK